MADYVRWRPRYPAALIPLLQRECGLRPDHVVADVGSGTGMSSEIFLENGNKVFAIEPNPAMAEAAISLLGTNPRHVSVRGRAEATGLADGEIDLVAAGQAFHWFDPEATRAEFRRILRAGGGAVVLVWNMRRTDSTAFLREYEAFLREWGTDYTEVSARYAAPEVLSRFFAPSPVTRHALPSHQVFDLAGLRGRLLSSSYAPPAGDARHEPMLSALQEIYERHAREGQVVFEYDTEVYWGRVS